MSLSQQWNEIERGLPDTWADARLVLTVPHPEQSARALALLGPFNPGRNGNTIRFATARGGQGFGPEHVRRLLRKLDGEKINGTLEVANVEVREVSEPVATATVVGAWTAALAVLPRDWSDLHVELQLLSTDHLERAALLLGPVNPGRFDGAPSFRFRVASRTGYGASAGMVHRCLERLDEAGIPAELRILRVLCDTKHVATQGPVWYVDGKAV
jgi:hypothetical protein